MILTIDVGTSVLKGAVVGLDGSIAANVSRKLPDNHTEASFWESCLAEIGRELCNKYTVDSVIFSGNGPTLTAVDSEGRTCMPISSWMDRRAVHEAGIIRNKTGLQLDPSFYLPKALYVKEKQPEIYEKTDWFLSCPEYLMYRLSGEAVTILPSRGYEPYIWNSHYLSVLGLDNSKFPPFVKPGDRAGSVTPTASEVYGIPSGIPVLAGGSDFLMALLGTGTTEPGRVCDRAGTSEGINLCSDRTPGDQKLLTLPHVIEGYYNISGMINTSGKALSWFAGIGGYSDFETIIKEASMAEPGAGGLLFLPYLAGERAPLWDPAAKGAFVGLTLSHGRQEMARAVMESTAYAFRQILEIMKMDDLHPERIVVTGGQARWSFWNQLKADITAQTLLLPRCLDAELMGTACLAAVGQGEYDNLTEGADAMVHMEQVFEPSGEFSALYEDQFGRYKELYPALKGVW